MDHRTSLRLVLVISVLALAGNALVLNELRSADATAGKLPANAATTKAFTMADFPVRTADDGRATFCARNAYSKPFNVYSQRNNKVGTLEPGQTRCAYGLDRRDVSIQVFDRSCNNNLKSLWDTTPRAKCILVNGCPMSWVYSWQGARATYMKPCFPYVAPTPVPTPTPVPIPTPVPTSYPLLPGPPLPTDEPWKPGDLGSRER